MNKTYKNIRLKIENRIAILTFDRPKQLNAMNRKMMDEIIDGIEIVNSNEEVAVAIIKGEGRAFMAGADIKEYGSQTSKQFKTFQQTGKKIYELLENSSKPWIAAINGFALGGGFEIALACDLILASDKATMGLPEVFLSLIPGGGGTQRLIQKIGITRVKEMLFFGNQYDAKTLYDWGIVNRIFNQTEFDVEVIKFAEKLSRRSPKSIKNLKKLANLSLTERPFTQRIDEEGEIVYQLFFDEDAQEAIRKFKDKK